MTDQTPAAADAASDARTPHRKKKDESRSPRAAAAAPRFVVHAPAAAGKERPEERCPNGMLIDDVWKAYKANPTRELRNVLMEFYLPLVHRTAQRLHAKLPSTVILDDLFSAGVLGLMDAIEGFQTDRQVRFSTFSATRIRGAILDELRSLDWVPRLVRTNAKKLDAARTDLESELGRPPCDDEVADRMAMPMGEFRDMVEDARAVMITSLSARRTNDNGGGGDDGQEVGPLPDQRAQDPVDESQRRALKAAITKGLSRAERLLVTLYYYENLTMREVGQVLDLSESRVSQMHTQIVRRLRATAGGHESSADSLREQLAA